MAKKENLHPAGQVSEAIFSWQHPDYVLYHKDKRWYIFSIIIVIMTVGIMGARMAHVSMLVMGGEVGILSVLHWLPLAAVPLAGIFLFIGALGVLSNRARRPIT